MQHEISLNDKQILKVLKTYQSKGHNQEYKKPYTSFTLVHIYQYKTDSNFPKRCEFGTSNKIVQTDPS